MTDYKSVAFITFNNGIYNDYWDEKNKDILMWYGQKSGKKDNLVKDGTALFTRKKNEKSFTFIGTVKSKEVFKKEDGKAVLYKLVINRFTEPIIIKREDTDLLTANTVLRKYGFPLEKGTMSHGIYAK